ncbi:MAG: sigma-70 family RNA polymerase sigma factor [Acidobacteria bacterium]|nr:sigma-70 family RNA polymerase sigma factor [Acidobacteriota bacterium]
MENLKEPEEVPSPSAGEEPPDLSRSTSLPSTSLRLFLRARRGEGSAVEALFGHLLPSLHRWARGRLPHWARRRMDTRDLVQDVFGAFFRQLPKVEPRRKRAIRAYLRQSIRNRIKDEVRWAGKVEVSAGSHVSWAAPGPSPLDQAVAAEELRRYRQGLEQLSPVERDLLVGRLELDYSFEQLALVTGKSSPDAARMATRRALLRLAEIMGPGERAE